MAQALYIGMDKVVYINNLRGGVEDGMSFVTVFIDEPQKPDRLVNHIAISWNRYKNQWDFDILNYWGHASFGSWGYYHDERRKE